MAIVHRRPKMWLNRFNPITTFTDHHFVARYRLPKDIVWQLAVDFQNSGFSTTNGDPRGGGISAEERFCLALRFLATGCNYAVIADFQGVNKSTLCRAVKEVTSFLASLTPRYLVLPNTRAQQLQKAEEFYHKFGRPCVIGCVDGSHIALMRPKVDEDSFINRKFFHSINVMFITDANLKIMHVDARFPSRVHDAFVLRSTALYDYGENGGFDGYWMLGDSGYPLKSWLLTPYGNPANDGQMFYNIWHKHTRASVERAFGLLKQRFRCLDSSAGYLMSSPETCARMVYACSVLHNIAIDARVPILVDNDEDGHRQIPRRRLRQYNAAAGVAQEVPAGANNATGVQVRNNFAATFEEAPDFGRRRQREGQVVRPILQEDREHREN